MDEDSSNALVPAAAHNDLVIVADPDHTDGNISNTVRQQLEGMQAQGVSHLFLEHDSQDVSLDTLRQQNSEYGRMIREAESLGMQVHLYDDRSKERDLDAKYPDQANERKEQDPYILDSRALVATASDPEKMQAYLNETQATMEDRLETRNTKIVENISTEMALHPGEKAVVLLGSAHMDTTRDVDEGLREQGIRTTTVEINSPETNGDNLVSRMSAQDKPDLIISSETGGAVSYKNPGTNGLLPTAGAESIPWQNQEPVKSGMEAALLQVREIDCSWAQDGAADVSSAEGGQFAPYCGQAPQTSSHVER